MPEHLTKSELNNRINANPKCVTKVAVIFGDRVNVTVEGIAQTFYWCSLKQTNMPQGTVEMNQLKAKLIQGNGTFIWYDRRNANEGMKYYFENGELARQKPVGADMTIENVTKVDFNAPTFPAAVPASVPRNSFEVPVNYWDFAGLQLPVRRLPSIPAMLHSWIPTADNGYVHQKEQTRRVMSCLIRQKAVLLKGHTGCGKSELLRSLAYHTGNPFIIIPCSGDMETSHLLGYNTVDSEGSIIFVEGLLTTAVRHGAWAYFDEFNAMSSDITTALNPLLDGSRCLVLTENKGAKVPMHENFRFVASGNPATHASYAGTKVQNLSLVNRMTTIMLDYLDHRNEEKILTNRFPSIPKEYIDRVVKIANEVRKLFKQNSIQAVMTTRDLIDLFEDAIILNQAHKNFDTALDDALASWVGKVDYQTDAKTIYGICKKHMTGSLMLMEEETDKIIG